MDDQRDHPSAVGAARNGARVIVRAPQGSMFDGRTGTIRRIYDGGTAFVALDHHPVLTPFALGELTALTNIDKAAR